MTNLRSWIKTVAAVALAALLLGLPAGHAVAGKGQPKLWSKGAKLEVRVGSYRPGYERYLAVSWPIADGADHYRLTATVLVDGFEANFSDSPVTYTIGTDGRAVWVGNYGSVDVLQPKLIIVTAYSGADEATAQSQSLRYRGH